MYVVLCHNIVLDINHIIPACDVQNCQNRHKAQMGSRDVRRRLRSSNITEICDLPTDFHAFGYGWKTISRYRTARCVGNLTTAIETQLGSRALYLIIIITIIRNNIRLRNPFTDFLSPQRSEYNIMTVTVTEPADSHDIKTSIYYQTERIGHRNNITLRVIFNVGNRILEVSPNSVEFGSATSPDII